MYFYTKSYTEISKAWLSTLKDPWLGGVILGIQNNQKDSPDPIFSFLKCAWNWRISSLFDLFFKPLVLCIVFAVSMVTFTAKLVFMLSLLPAWQFIALLYSIKAGLPNHEPTWLSPYD